MLGFIYVSIFCIYTLHITYLYFNSWQCLTLTVILWNFWIIWIVWQWWIGVFKWLKSGPGVDTQYLVTSLRQLIHLSAAFSSPLLWPKWWYFSFRKHLMLWNSFQICVEKDLVVWSSSETLRNSKTRKERQGHPKKQMLETCSARCSPFFCWKCSSSFVRSLSCLTFGTHGVLKSLACWVGSLWMLQKEHEEWCEGKTLPATAFDWNLFVWLSQLRWHSWLDMSRKMLLTTMARCHWYCPQASVCWMVHQGES